MRTEMKRFAKFFSVISIALSLSALLLVFQNCGSMEAAYNPLYDSTLQSGCIGVSCTRDISMAGFKSTVSGILIDNKTATSSAATCDNSTCFDLGGYCETGGFPNSVFTYQWILNGVAQTEVSTSASCDDNGRFYLQVKVPFAQFDYTASNRLLLTMKVIDENGAIQSNPTGSSQLSYDVTVRQ